MGLFSRRKSKPDGSSQPPPTAGDFLRRSLTGSADDEAIALVSPTGNGGPSAWHQAVQLGMQAWDQNRGNSSEQQDKLRIVLTSYIVCQVAPHDAVSEFLTCYERLIMEAPGDKWAFDCAALGGMLFDVAEQAGRNDIIERYTVRFLGSCDASTREGQGLTAVAGQWSRRMRGA